MRKAYFQQRIECPYCKKSVLKHQLKRHSFSNACQIIYFNIK